MHLSNSRANSTKMRERKITVASFFNFNYFYCYGLAKKNIVSVVFSSSIQSSSRFFASELTFQIFEIKNTHPAISIRYMPCPSTSTKIFWLLQIFCARPKINLHILCQSQTFCVKPKDDSLLCLVLLQVPKSFVPVQIFCVRQKLILILCPFQTFCARQKMICF